MRAENIRRGFHRIGILVAAPCAVGAAVGMIGAILLYCFPVSIGSTFRLGITTSEEAQAAIKSPDALRILRNIRRMQEQGAQSAELKHYLQTEGWTVEKLQEAVPRSMFDPELEIEAPYSEALALSKVCAAIAGSLLLIGALWYATMRSLAWVIAGFMIP